MNQSRQKTRDKQIDAVAVSDWRRISARLLAESIDAWDEGGDGCFEDWLSDEFWGRWYDLQELN